MEEIPIASESASGEVAQIHTEVSCTLKTITAYSFTLNF